MTAVTDAATPVAESPSLVRTVRDACWEVFRTLGLTRFFANPGSTEVPLLAGFPDDFDFILGLHETSVVGMATGWALARSAPALVLLHTTAGLGNAVGALATARENRVPLVVLVGQQDRRHLVSEPFLTGRLEDLAGDYPVWVGTPPRAKDLPDIITRAYHEAELRRGPALVIVPMDDWLESAPTTRSASPVKIEAGVELPGTAATRLATALGSAARPVIVAGSGAATLRSWAALEQISAKLGAPVWQEPFGARPGFRQNAASFRGLLSAGRAGVRDQLAGHDLVFVVGAQSLRQYGYEPGPLFAEGTRVIVLSDEIGKAVVSTADLAVVASVDSTLEALARHLPGGPDGVGDTPLPAPPASDVLTPPQVYGALARRLDADAAVFEETPSSRDDLVRYCPARSPLGYISAAMGGLGFAMPTAVGLRMASPKRQVVAIVGDGSAIYSIQALWSAQRYEAGVLFVILANGRYAIMDRLASLAGGMRPWPGFGDLSFEQLAAGFGCRSQLVTTVDELDEALDVLVPLLREGTEPMVLIADVAADAEAVLE
ncbi:thiamine pyrophosphate-dependent enzyme [Lysinimonas soli]|uniref:Thiamine pyrophosphate-dependent enzyme n=1 Tax=Lysinimonas soli TaxID=1074233 RepID=A0ABW0NLM6_9MICO